MPKHQTVGDAYIETITNRVMTATGHQKAEPFKHKMFRQDARRGKVPPLDSRHRWILVTAGPPSL